MKKYKLLKSDKITVGDRTLYRVKRISDGLLGGYIESESNLSQEGDCFVYGNARVYGNAWVYGNARVYGNVLVYDNARVYGNAWVYDNTELSKPQDLICVSGLQFHITVTPQNAVIGCKLKTHKEWLAVTKKEAAEMGLSASEYAYFKTLLKMLFRKVGK
jgi:hypothetical protein